MDETIKIDPSADNKLEFDVVLQNTDGFEAPRVRFITSNAMEDVETIHKCTRVPGEKDKWSTTLTPLQEKHGETLNYRIEVIVDGYYFEAANGSLELAPLAESAKPKVSVSFAPAPILMEVKEFDDIKVKEKEVPKAKTEIKPKTKPVKQIVEEVTAEQPIEVTPEQWKNVRSKIFKR